MKKFKLTKKDLARIVISGVAALIIHKIEGIVNDRTDSYFGPDKPKQAN